MRKAGYNKLYKQVKKGAGVENQNRGMWFVPGRVLGDQNSITIRIKIKVESHST